MSKTLIKYILFKKYPEVANAPHFNVELFAQKIYKVVKFYEHPLVVIDGLQWIMKKIRTRFDPNNQSSSVETIDWVTSSDSSDSEDEKFKEPKPRRYLEQDQRATLAKYLYNDIIHLFHKISTVEERTSYAHDICPLLCIPNYSLRKWGVL